jgi:two-component system chemotaxis response regulator CheY
MVVDDSRVVYAEMKKMLEGSEIEIVGFCRSGEEALEKYEELHPDLVTLDIVMPGMDGMETCEKLKARWPDAQVFMVSSMAYDDMIDRAAALGAKGFLFKPFTRETLLEGLRGAFKALHV